MIKPITMIALLALASCATPSKGPVKPKESHRVPINRTLPPELEGQTLPDMGGPKK